MGDDRRPEEGSGTGWGQPPGGPPPGGSQQPGWGQPPGGPSGGTNGLAVAALICGLLALPLAIVLIGGLVGFVAVILGIVGLTRVRVTGTGRGLAIGGIIAGGLAVVVAVGVLAIGIRIFSDPEIQELFEQELERQEQLREQG